MVREIGCKKIRKFKNIVISLEQIKKDKNGNIRYKATIVDLLSEKYLGAELSNKVYTFTGHGMGPIGEIEWIYKYYKLKFKKVNEKKIEDIKVRLAELEILAEHGLSLYEKVEEKELQNMLDALEELVK
jgi:hypothetical protein